MGYNIKARKTKYKGIWFKSNLEAQVAEGLDNIHVEWEYESRTFRDRRYVGGQYTPDFYLPASCMYVEVVGVLDARHEENAFNFCMLNNVKTVDDIEERICREHGEIEFPVINEDCPEYILVDGDGGIKDATNGDICHTLVTRCDNCGCLFTYFNDCTCRHCGKTCDWEHGTDDFFLLADMDRPSKHYKSKNPRIGSYEMRSPKPVEPTKRKTIDSKESHGISSIDYRKPYKGHGCDTRWISVVDEVLAVAPARGSLLLQSWLMSDDGHTLTILLPKGSGFAVRMLDRADVHAIIDPIVHKRFGKRNVVFEELGTLTFIT